MKLINVATILALTSIPLAGCSSSASDEHIVPLGLGEVSFPEVVAHWSQARYVAIAGAYTEKEGCLFSVNGTTQAVKNEEWGSAPNAAHSSGLQGGLWVVRCSARLMAPEEKASTDEILASGGKPTIMILSVSLPRAVKDGTFDLPVSPSPKHGAVKSDKAAVYARFEGAGVPPSWAPFEAKSGIAVVVVENGKVAAISFKARASNEVLAGA
jgi:hypothetical protein